MDPSDILVQALALCELKFLDIWEAFENVELTPPIEIYIQHGHHRGTLVIDLGGHNALCTDIHLDASECGALSLLLHVELVTTGMLIVMWVSCDLNPTMIPCSAFANVLLFDMSLPPDVSPVKGKFQESGPPATLEKNVHGVAPGSLLTTLEKSVHELIQGRGRRRQGELRLGRLGCLEVGEVGVVDFFRWIRRAGCRDGVGLVLAVLDVGCGGFGEWEEDRDREGRSLVTGGRCLVVAGLRRKIRELSNCLGSEEAKA
ncbi:hypothetical protein M5K25_020952 [Dendrobium thyrsiflorum]|uniref:Uncharacterized protein n=1 Tax=Dendrobium thyrsiflorum TaxID=117978 RepID=A0ABD0UI79_DENTH